jgi:hypothetical protein
VELVVAGHLLDELARRRRRILEDDEVADQVEEAPRSKTPSITTCSSGRCGRRASRPVMVRQGLNHSLPGAERADARLHAVGDDQHGVGREQRGTCA